VALRDRAGGIVSGIMDYLGQTGDEQILNGLGATTFPGKFPRNPPMAQDPAPGSLAMPMSSAAPSIGREAIPQLLRKPALPDQGGNGVRMTPDMEKKAQIAANVTEQLKTNPMLDRDPSFQEKVKGFFGSRENMIRLAMGFNTMRLNPDAGLAASLGSELKDIRKAGATSATAKAVATRLRSMGPEYAQYATMVENNPSLANEVMKQILQKEFKPEVAIKTSASRVDEKTGKVYVIKTDPNTGESTRVEIEGATGLTTQGTLDLERLSNLKEQDQQTAMAKGSEIFGKAQALDSQISKYRAALGALDRGAATGWWNKYLPTFRAATQEFQMLANSLGIDIINSATFGALSESELKLALQTGLPDNLGPDETVALIKRKVAAQEKLRNQLYNDARMLSTGTVRYTDYMQKRANASLDSRDKQPASPAEPSNESTPGFKIVGVK